MFVIIHTLLHKIITFLSLESLSSSFLLIFGFEEVSCHKSYSYEEINSANNLREFGSRSCSRQASDENPVLADTLIAIWKILSRGPNQAILKFLIHRSYDKYVLL